MLAFSKKIWCKILHFPPGNRLGGPYSYIMFLVERNQQTVSVAGLNSWWPESVFVRRHSKCVDEERGDADLVLALCQKIVIAGTNLTSISQQNASVLQHGSSALHCNCGINWHSNNFHTSVISFHESCNRSSFQLIPHCSDRNPSSNTVNGHL